MSVTAASGFVASGVAAGIKADGRTDLSLVATTDGRPVPAAAVFTQSGSHARYVMDHASAGMIGVNIGVPVPREPFSFGGWNESKFGACDITGKSSIEFWTQLKKTTTKWNPESRTNWMS